MPGSRACRAEANDAPPPPSRQDTQDKPGRVQRLRNRVERLEARIAKLQGRITVNEGRLAKAKGKLEAAVTAAATGKTKKKAPRCSRAGVDLAPYDSRDQAGDLGIRCASRRGDGGGPNADAPRVPAARVCRHEAIRHQSEERLVELVASLVNHIEPKAAMDEATMMALLAAYPSLEGHLLDLDAEDGVSRETSVRRRTDIPWILSFEALHEKHHSGPWSFANASPSRSSITCASSR
jgi:hypothetical protein